MNSVFFKQRAPRLVSVFFSLLLATSLFPARLARAQEDASAVDAAAQVGKSPTPTTQTQTPTSQTPAPQTPVTSPALTPEADAATVAPLFRMERVSVAGGAELLTVFGSLHSERASAGGAGAPASSNSDVPLLSILRDTLGDDDPENDRLRYVWMHTYVRPTFGQRFASGVPFLYSHVSNRTRADAVPPAVMDLAAPDKDVWRRMMWVALQSLFFDPYGIAVKSTVRTLRRNADDYRKAHIIRALAILALYDAETGTEPAFSPVEMREIQARLMLAERTFGGIIDDSYLQRVYEKETTLWADLRGHNWELLRQRAEEEGLYFEPLQLPDNTATHALLWVARTDLNAPRTRPFRGRFLNIADPWGDKRLSKWDGYTQTRYLDAENRFVAADTPGARRVELIPLALYGLDHPKIPMLLVDFRDGGNPKRREMSRRLLEDVARNILSLSKFGDLHYFLGRTVYDYVTNKRGMDVNQPSRLRAYSQLKLLLTLSDALDPALRNEVSRRAERVSMNPLENDAEAETRIAREQHAALLNYAERPDGLPAKLDRDRRAEMVPLAHGRTARVMFRLANMLSLGLYTHREGAQAATQREQLDVERRLAFHRRFLREVSKSSPLVEVAWNMEDVRRSLTFIAQYGARADAKTAAAAARIFTRTQDDETRRLCLNSLYRINNETAKAELLRIYQTPDLDPQLRIMSAELLRMAMREEQRISRDDARTIASVVGQ